MTTLPALFVTGTVDPRIFTTDELPVRRRIGRLYDMIEKIVFAVRRSSISALASKSRAPVPSCARSMVKTSPDQAVQLTISNCPFGFEMVAGKKSPAPSVGNFDPSPDLTLTDVAADPSDDDRNEIALFASFRAMILSC